MSHYIFYKIVCEDCPDYIYIGSTKSFRSRKYQHKSNCININQKSYNLKLYEKIRENGGWNNWNMIIIDEEDDLTFTQARIKEEELRLKYNGNLNLYKAYTTEEEAKERNKKIMKNYYENNKEKLTQYKKEYIEKNKEQVKEYKKKYNENNKEKYREYKKLYYQKNKEEITEYKKEYYENNKEALAEKKKEYREVNKEKLREYNKEYYKNNKEKAKEYYQKKKAEALNKE